MASNEFHISRFDAVEPHRPFGGWSVYRISGDEIAQRIEFDADGRVSARHGWCGYVGCFQTLDDAMTAIEGERKRR